MLKIRRQREDHHRRIVADRLREIHRIVDQREALGQQIDQANQMMRIGQGEGTVDVQQLVRSRHWLGHLQRTMLELEATQRGHEAKLAQERAALADAARQRRILEKLKDRQLEQFHQEQQRREVRDADEYAVMRYAFDRAGGEDAPVVQKSNT